MITGYREGKPFQSDAFTLFPKYARDLSILDFGCGIGRNFAPLERRARTLTAFDIPEMIDACHRQIPCASVYLTADWWHLRQRRFDVTVASLVLQHLIPGQSLDFFLSGISRISPFLYVVSRAWCDGPGARNLLAEILDSGHFDFVTGSVPLEQALAVTCPDETHLEFVVRSRHCPASSPAIRRMFDAPRLDYAYWLKCFGSSGVDARRRIAREIAGWEDPPLISVVVPTHKPDLDLLGECLDSVREQSYPHWELCIADDATPGDETREFLRAFQARDPRIKLVFCETHGHISATSNAALQLVTGEFVALLDQDDLLAEEALYHVARTIREFPRANLIYSDEDKIDMEGSRRDPYFKCEFNHDLLLGHNMISHLGVYRTRNVRMLDGFTVGLEGSQDYDLALRMVETCPRETIVHVPRVLYHWRLAPGSTAQDSANKPYAFRAAQRAIAAHLARRGIDADVDETPGSPGSTRIRYHIPSPSPAVTLIIPTRDRLEYLERCISSLRERTEYEHYELLIIDNDSRDQETLDYLRRLVDQGQARVIRFPGEFNYSSMMNLGVTMCGTELVGMLNNDTEVINGTWLRELVSHAIRPGVGIVGARLWYPDDRLQHAGVILGINGIAGHYLRGLPRGGSGALFGRENLVQELSAVTGACMVMRRSVYRQVGGMDSERLPVSFNDIDLCLKVRARGLRVIWTPHAELYHHESASRGSDDTPEARERAMGEAQTMRQRWGSAVESDPAYSPNLSNEDEQPGLAFPPRH